MDISDGEVAVTLMARDYKDPQCVVIEDNTDEPGNSGDSVCKRIP